MIRASRVTVRFGARAALDDVTFEAKAGELVGVVGRAASGKTTLLKTLCLLVRPDAGVVELDGESLGDLGTRELAKVRARLGYAFQNLALFDRLDATENVSFALVRRGVEEEEARRTARAQLKAVGLEAAATKHPHELSGGMKRRLALARALVTRPEVALFDDPFVGLDPVACARIARLIQTAHRETGGATIVAAGDPAPLFAVADRIVLLEDGRVAADLDARTFEQAEQPAVGRYLGRGAAA